MTVMRPFAPGIYLKYSKIDHLQDVEAGTLARTRTIVVDCEYKERRPEHYDAGARSMADAARWILARERG